MTQGDVLYRFRLRTMALAEELGNVRAACRIMGIHPDIWALISHLEESGADVVILVTDGIDTGAATTSSPENIGRNPLLLVLVLAREKYGGIQATRDVAARWEAVGASTFPYQELSAPSAWQLFTNPKFKFSLPTGQN